MTEPLSQFFASIPSVFQGLLGMIASASVLTAMTPTPRDDRWVGKAYRILEILALNIGRAKDLPSNRGREGP